ncbi:MAG: hypothetical protein R3A10_15640 [Caldilineaceae bacterium]
MTSQDGAHIEDREPIINHFFFRMDGHYVTSRANSRAFAAAFVRTWPLKQGGDSCFPDDSIIAEIRRMPEQAPQVAGGVESVCEGRKELAVGRTLCVNDNADA